MSSTVEVSTPSRLHFGMFSFGHPNQRQFGGVGVMVQRPGIRLRIVPAERFEVVGPLAHRVVPVIQRLAEHGLVEMSPACRVEIDAAPPEHLGLGTGTQLELALAAALNALAGGPALDANELARLTGRGARSAIGTYGFLLGGLVVERGKLPTETLAPLEARVDLPDAWRFVLIFPHAQPGLAGEAERTAFRNLPPVPREITASLWSEVLERLLPSAKAGDFASFGESLYRFGHLAGTCFEPSQGGAFAGRRVTELVATVRGFGMAGVGQSSWGPTIFVLARNEDEAQRLGQQLDPHLEAGENWLITSVCRHGAKICRSGCP